MFVTILLLHLLKSASIQASLLSVFKDKGEKTRVGAETQPYAYGINENGGFVPSDLVEKIYKAFTWMGVLPGWASYKT